jgi:DNA-directed RNA polymerase subunit RPC12/RpoP
VTLIAAWRCPNGIVIHADSQETVTMEDGVEYRNTVQKIEPLNVGNYRVVISGAGNAALTVSFIEKIKRRLGSDPSEGLKAFVSLFEDELSAFYSNDVALCPDSDKTIQFVVAAVSTRTSECEAWVTKNTTLCPIADNELSGWGETLYKEVANKFYRRDMTIHQAVLAGIYLLTLAEGTSNYVRSPFKVAVIRENGVWMEPDENVHEIADRLRDYEQRLNDIFLACADTSIHVHKLEQMLVEFANAVLGLHRTHIDRIVSLGGLQGLMKTNDPYPRLPLGSIVTGMADGRLVFEHDAEKITRRLAQFDKYRALALAAPHYLRCFNCGTELEYKLYASEKSQEPGAIECPDCKATNKIPRKASEFRKIGGSEWKRIVDSVSP